MNRMIRDGLMGLGKLPWIEPETSLRPQIEPPIVPTWINRGFATDADCDHPASPFRDEPSPATKPEATCKHEHIDIWADICLDCGKKFKDEPSEKPEGEFLPGEWQTGKPPKDGRYDIDAGGQQRDFKSGLWYFIHCAAAGTRDCYQDWEWRLSGEHL